MATVAVLGIGAMGAGMAQSLVRAGHDVRVWNRTRERAEEIEGATVAGSPAEAVRGADVLLTVLPDGQRVQEVAGDALDGAEPGLVWIQASTVGLSWTDRLADVARARGVVFVDAPVLGTKAPAEAGELVVLAGGPDEARERCEPVFDAIGRKTVWVGPVGAGTKLKLVVNAWVVALVAGVAETVALAQALGLDPQLFLDSISGGNMDVPYAHLKGKAIIEREFPASFKLRLARKDVGLILEAADQRGLELEVLRGVEREMERAIVLGHGDEDFAALAYAVLEG